jgi:hypothetical protein
MISAPRRGATRLFLHAIIYSNKLHLRILDGMPEWLMGMTRISESIFTYHMTSVAQVQILLPSISF